MNCLESYLRIFQQSPGKLVWDVLGRNACHICKDLLDLVCFDALNLLTGLISLMFW